ncbi:MAG: sodium:proline symporter [Ketobacter sp.]|nr:MAG: sodium:proline symporter [Ketobacter sp.]
MYRLQTLDWIIIACYLAGLMLLAAYLSRGQFNREDYYVGGRKLTRWPIAISIMATQCSTNSILGAPAFVAFAAGGGLVWLQYELAVPIAMVALMIIFMPLLRDLRLVTVYEYLERRFDIRTRLILSGVFMFVRAFATAVTVYSIAIVIDLITGLGFTWSVILLGLFTVLYDVLGGIKGVIYSDVVQMSILLLMLVFVAYMLADQGGGILQVWQTFPEARRTAVDFTHHGFGDGHSFAFWPMLLGGFFLYVSYYGCDQSQAQRVLSAHSVEEANQALFLNGLLRFPVVALYCFVGVGMGVYAANQADFLSTLPQNNGQANVNLAVPVYMIQQLPVGLVGLALVALFAAAMSSLDSVLNSLSASTMEDFVGRFKKTRWTDTAELFTSRVLTLFWGSVTLTLAFFVDDIAPTVLETINKIGSLINGPVLAVFTLGVLTRWCHSLAAIAGLLCGFLFNIYLWLGHPGISWLWWNLIGFAVAVLVAALVSAVCSPTAEEALSEPDDDLLLWSLPRLRQLLSQTAWKSMSFILLGWFLVLLVVLMCLN